MATARPARGPTLLRPFLGVTRAALEAYARDRRLEWVEDESNADERRARNLVRRSVMPLLARLNPAAAANLARSAAHLAEAQELTRALAALDAREAMRAGRLSAAALARLGPARARNLLRWTIAEAGLAAPDAARLDEILRQLVGARVDAGVRIALDGAEIRRYRDAVWLVPAQAAPPAAFRARWDGRPTWPLPELGGTLRFKATTGVGMAARALGGRLLEVRLRAGGERFQPDGQRPRRMLKTLLQESGVPPWERERLPLLYCGGKLVAVPGIGVAAGAAAAPGEPAWTVSWGLDRPKLPKPAKAMIK
jgi:tRNA(Ile)-lysidine synthase